MVAIKEQEFVNTIDSIMKILNENGTKIETEKYDGIIIKKLASTNTIGNTGRSHQSHIAITSNQMDIFPYLQSDGYFNEEPPNENLKKYFNLQVPIYVSSSNQAYLNNQTCDIENKIKCHVSVVRSKRTNQSDQIQLHIKSKDTEEFESFRKLLNVDDYLIILKIKEKFEYEAYGIRSNYDLELKKFNNKFYYLKTETTITTDIYETDDSSDELNDESGEMKPGENILLYGVPGCGKSWTIENEYCNDDERMEKVVFHPDYTYSEFVGQILPEVSDNQVTYKFTPGPFTTILKKANMEENKNKKFYLILEEINRGNAPAIFGDIFQLLDRKKEQDNDNSIEIGASEYGITNKDIAQIVYGNPEKKVRIPSNLSIIGTMNTSDQNVFTLDTAFQRRWTMRLIKNSFKNVDTDFKNTYIVDTSVTWEKFCTEINQIILDKNSNTLSSEDKRFGVYFATKDDLKDPVKFSEKILKYLWDDAFKFSREDIFDYELNCLESVIIYFVNSKSDDRFGIFKDSVFYKLIN